MLVEAKNQVLYFHRVRVSKLFQFMCCSHALGFIFRTIAQIIFSLYMHTHTQNNSHLFLVYFSIADALPYGLWL